MNTTRMAALLAVVGAAITALPAAAQQADPAAQDGDIVVEGQVDRRQVQRTTRDISPELPMSDAPVPRFQRPVCPGVWGLTAENGQAVIDRIYDNARQAEVPVNEEAGCRANLWVIFVDDPAATFAQLVDDGAFLVDRLDYTERRRVERQDGPIRAWNLISTRNRDGEVVASGREVAAASADARAAGGMPGMNNVTSLSRLDGGVRRDLELSVMLVQRSAIAQLDAHAVADYATMRLLAQTLPPDRDDVADTVLTLFEADAAPPERMTVFDRAYLRSVYQSDELRPHRFAVRNVQNLMEHDFSGQEE